MFDGENTELLLHFLKNDPKLTFPDAIDVFHPLQFLDLQMRKISTNNVRNELFDRSSFLLADFLKCFLDSVRHTGSRFWNL